MQPQQFSLYGAVDLGARQAAAQRRQQQAERAAGQAAPGDGAGASVLEVTEETFATEVVERSRSVPVIVDLWAEWCQPCKQLSPVLEKLAAEADGGWVLAKVDVEANPQLSAALRVQSIPTVMAVIAGQVVDGFLGALPEPQVREWLTQVVAVAEQLGVRPAQGGAVGVEQPGQGPADQQPGRGPADQRPAAGRPGGMPGPRDAGPRRDAAHPAHEAHPAYEAAQQAMERGDFDGAAAAFEQALASAPDDPVAKVGLAQVDLIRRVSSYDQARTRRDAAEHPDDVDAQARVADLDLAMGKIEEAFDRLLGTIRRTGGDDRDRARRHLVSLFEILPPRDPRVARARSALASLLF